MSGVTFTDQGYEVSPREPIDTIYAREYTTAVINYLRGLEASSDRKISVVRDARVAASAGQVHAMHDPTEGGLASALWELAEASGRGICFDPSAVTVPPLSARACRSLGLDPLRAIASGALLLTTPKFGCLSRFLLHPFCDRPMTASARVCLCAVPDGGAPAWRCSP